MNRDEALKLLAVSVTSVEVPGRGTFHVRGMDGHGRAAWFQHVTESTDEAGNVINREGFKAKLLQLTMCDGSGALLFTPDDLAAIVAIDAWAVDVLFDATLRINKLTKEATESAGATFPK